MGKLELEFAILEQIFTIDTASKVIKLRPLDDGSLRTSLNTQQLYNWYRNKQREHMHLGNFIEDSGFIGLQPIIKFIEGLKIEIPKVPKFVIHGYIATLDAGEFPYIIDSNTALIISQYSRPNCKLFLSHSSIDKPFVRELRESLYSVCETFFDETDIKYGQSITERLDTELKETDMLVLVFSKNAAESEWVRKEWSAMFHMGKPLVVIRIDDHELFPLLKDKKYIRYIDSVQSVCNDIVSAIEK